jgi:hypothetical protein
MSIFSSTDFKSVASTDSATSACIPATTYSRLLVVRKHKNDSGNLDAVNLWSGVADLPDFVFRLRGATEPDAEQAGVRITWIPEWDRFYSFSSYLNWSQSPQLPPSAWV